MGRNFCLCAGEWFDRIKEALIKLLLKISG